MVWAYRVADSKLVWAYLVADSKSSATAFMRSLTLYGGYGYVYGDAEAVPGR